MKVSLNGKMLISIEYMINVKLKAYHSRKQSHLPEISRIGAIAVKSPKRVTEVLEKFNKFI
jgi:hypothetical protein